MITSRNNNLVKSLRAVRDGREQELIFVEGVRLCEEAASQSEIEIIDVLYTVRLQESARGLNLLEQLSRRSNSTRLTPATEDVLASIADTRTNQGIALVAARPQTGADKFATNFNTSPLIVVLDGVTNPANAGAILRAAEAAGATGAISTVGTCDLFSPKALRGAMGSAFRLPLWTNAATAEISTWLAARDIQIFTLDARAVAPYTDADWRLPSAFVVGEEGSGFTRREIQGEMLRIPMRPAVESLNVAVAVGVVLYEAARQRGFQV